MSLKQLLLIAALVLLPQCVTAKVIGDVEKIPQEPGAYTVFCFPANYEQDQESQKLISASVSDPVLSELRRSTQVQEYDAANPDFRHRFAKTDRDAVGCLPEVTRDGKPAVLVIQDGKLLFGASGSAAEIVSAAHSHNVLAGLNRSGCRPNCPSCPLRHPKDEPKDKDTEPLKPLRPILPPLIEREATKIVEKEAESNPLGIIGIIAAAMAPLSLVAGIGSYFITRSVDENEALD